MPTSIPAASAAAARVDAPRIAPPTDLTEVPAFGAALGRVLDEQPSLEALAPHTAAFDRIDDLVSAVEHEADLAERDWARYATVPSAERPASVSMPGDSSLLRDGARQVHETLATLRTLVDVARAAGAGSPVNAEPSLVTQAREGLLVLEELDTVIRPQRARTIARGLDERSRPGPPTRTSLPPRPGRRSLPVPPDITSRPGPPARDAARHAVGATTSKEIGA